KDAHPDARRRTTMSAWTTTGWTPCIGRSRPIRREHRRQHRQPASPRSDAQARTVLNRRTRMQITRNSVGTAAGPSDWFTGSVYVDAVATPSGPSRLSASSVHFTPGARTAWHTHPNGQTIYVLEGVGLAQRRGDPVEVI